MFCASNRRPSCQARQKSNGFDPAHQQGQRLVPAAGLFTACIPEQSACVTADGASDGASLVSRGQARTAARMAAGSARIGIGKRRPRRGPPLVGSRVAALTRTGRFPRRTRRRARKSAKRAQQTRVFAAPFFIFGREQPAKPKRIGEGLAVRRQRLNHLKPLHDLARTEFPSRHFSPRGLPPAVRAEPSARWRLSGNWPGN